MIFGFFKQDKKPDLTEELKRIRARNDARFKAVKEQMEREGKHMLSKGFKWIPTDEWKAQRGIL